MSRKQPKALSLREGTWFAVPLRGGGYAVGRIARYAPREGIMLAYFFGPKRERIPTLEEVESLQPRQAIEVMRTTDLGLVEGRWIVLGDSACWEREAWPIPPFIRRDEIGHVAWRVVYSDEVPNEVVSEELIPYETTGLGPDGLYGHLAAEVRLSQLLGG
jgi:hypothetical protein